ncbi:hypothetical protein [uncultured Vibrio sp.]|uniref:ribonuclease T2 family protein n=1 Tax=uncultured Vibrio sp. TaxID=114054 RepID=UPI0025E0C77C|nr:hypothetical protein [uncultured Vibrio sp.]
MKWIILIGLLTPFTVHATCNVDMSMLNLNYDAVMTDTDVSNHGETDLFILVYSNSPRFCKYAESQGFADKIKFQCESENDFGWVLHGLWAENKQMFIEKKKDGHPRWCKGDLEMESIETLVPYICMSPGTALLQGEWEKHGACDFESAEQYFSMAKKLHDELNLPPKETDTSQAIKWMVDNNQLITIDNIVNMNHEFAICYSKSFNLMNCPVE